MCCDTRLSTHAVCRLLLSAYFDYRMMSDWKVDLVNDNISELYVEFKGPPDSESNGTSF